MRKTKSPEAPIIVTKCYDFVLWLAPKIEKFPRSLRFSVGERLLGSSLDLLLLLVQAAYAGGKERWLDEASQKANAIRYLLRLSQDLRLLPLESYLTLSGCDWSERAADISMSSKTLRAACKSRIASVFSAAEFQPWCASAFSMTRLIH